MSEYFARLTAAVAAAGLHRPVLVIDQQSLTRNLDSIRRGVPDPTKLRLADKSIPVPALLDLGFKAFGTNRVMSFHLPLTAQVLDRFPDANVLMGKPMPVGAAAAFLAANPHADRVTWLIDSLPRLAEYRDLGIGRDLQIAFEVNVGLGRGGFETPETLRQVVGDVGALNICGVMGYEAHVNSLPKLLGRGHPAQNRAMARLAEFADVLPPTVRETINTGGSSTLLGLSGAQVANDFTVGSLMVKPSDFDQSINGPINPAMFIVTPVLKTCRHQLPGHPKLTSLLQRTRIIRERIAFAYGGKWMANPVFPKGLTASPFFSASSNQHGFCLPNGDDAPEHLVLRPTQSEAVLQQFPEIHVFDGETIVNTWSPFAIS